MFVQNISHTNGQMLMIIYIQLYKTASDKFTSQLSDQKCGRGGYFELDIYVYYSSLRKNHKLKVHSSVAKAPLQPLPIVIYGCVDQHDHILGVRVLCCGGEG